MITVTSLRGKRVEWVLRYRDASNYCLAQLDDSALVRYQIAGGARSTVTSVSLKLKKGGAVQVRIRVRESVIVHRVFRNGAWQVLSIPGSLRGARRRAASDSASPRGTRTV